jgi:hypothetical protein
MVDNDLPEPIGRETDLEGFEQLKRFNPHAAEYWSARDLQGMLGYNHWRSFE